VEQAVEICEKMGNPHIGIMADFFHMNIEEGINHMNIEEASIPGRHPEGRQMGSNTSTWLTATACFPGWGHTDSRAVSLH
jgi:hypothetical protein